MEEDTQALVDAAEEVAAAVETAAESVAPAAEAESSGIDLEAILQLIVEKVSEYGLSLLAAIAIFVIGRMVAGFVTSKVRSLLESRKVEPSLVGFAASMTHALLLVVVVLAALGQLGIQTTSFVAIIGAAGLAIGLALQGSLSNFAAGVLILIFKPYRVGDYVVAGGAEGIIDEIGIFTKFNFV